MDLMDESKLHPGCVVCRKQNRAKSDIVNPDTGKVIIRKGDFAIQCKGIPKDPVDEIVQITERAGVRSDLEESDIVAMATVKDPVFWAKENVTVLSEEDGQRGPWVPQGASAENIEKYKLDETSAYYQELMVRCTARRVVTRLGRRSGKSWTLTIKALHKMVTNRGYRVMVITPGQAQLDLIFERVNNFLTSSPSLSESKVTYRKTPQRYIELSNGSFMIGFVSGNDGMRGQAADMIIIDEADYLGTDDLSAITAILTEHSSTILIVASTPTGKREQFYKWDHDPAFRSFHYPSMCRPNWDDTMDLEMRKECPGVKYDHEILAEYGEIADGVFQHSHIDRATADGQYLYSDSEPEEGYVYCMGVDWNPVHGTEIVIIGNNPSNPKSPYKTVDCGQVFREGATQIQAMNEIIRLNRVWQPAAIYVDRGAGSVQIELLQELGSRAEANTPDKRLETIVKAIDFGSKIDMRHPVNGTIYREYAKPAVVENAVRFMESDRLLLSKYDMNLTRALRGYVVDKIGSNGRPVYRMVSDEIEDHRLDAWMLALFAFTMEFSKLGTPDIVPTVRFAGRFGEEPTVVKNGERVPSRMIRPKDSLTMEERREEAIERGLNYLPSNTIMVNTWEDGRRIASDTKAKSSSEKKQSSFRRSRGPISRSMFR
jgi:hypothetical protein